MSTFRLEDVLSTWFESFKEELYTSEPGVVTSFDESKMTASVQPIVQKSYNDEAGDKVYSSKPVIQNVRVLYPGGRMLFRLEPGSPGQLLFCSASLDNWSPTTSRPSPPVSDRTHHLTDAIFIPGFPGKITTYNKPDDDEVVLAWDVVKLGSALTSLSRSPVVTKKHLENWVLAMPAQVTALRAAAAAAAIPDPPLAVQLNSQAEGLEALRVSLTAFLPSIVTPVTATVTPGG